MMTETGKISAAVVEFADVQVIDDDGPKVLVRLGEINNGEPVDVAVVVMAPELANILSAGICRARGHRKGGAPGVPRRLADHARSWHSARAPARRFAGDGRWD